MKNFENGNSWDKHSNLNRTLKKILLTISPCKISEDDISNQTLLREDLGLDSFAALEVLACLEKIFALRISSSEIIEMETFQDLMSLVFSKLPPANSKIRSA